MSDPIVLSFKELAALIVRDRGIREGNWGLWVRFGIGATNIGEDINSVVPAAIVPVLELGIQEFNSETGLTVNARDVWKQAASRSARASKSKRTNGRPRTVRTKK